VLMLVLSLWLLPRFGIVGLAWAQMGQALLQVLGGRLLLCRTLPSVSVVPLLWRKSVLREMLSYCANLQVGTVFMLLLDPVAKALIAGFGGPSAAGYFEMANQIATKARGVIVMANRAIVPRATMLAETNDARLPLIYLDNMRILVFV